MDLEVHSGQATGRARAGNTRAQRMSKPFCALRASLDTEEDACDSPPSETSPSSALDVPSTTRRLPLIFAALGFAEEEDLDLDSRRRCG